MSILVEEMKRSGAAGGARETPEGLESASTLYLCYFGLREPLVQTQVLPYLRQLAASGVEVHLLTFEPRFRRAWSRREVEEERARMRGQGIRWHATAYHKSPSLPATLYDIAAGAAVAARLVRRERIQVLHARHHVACAVGLLVKRLTGARLLFDIRGFMAEEYTDAGVWPRGGYLFRWCKAAERRMLAGSDAFVVLTEKAREILFPGCADADERGRPIEVIPCCVDLERFRAAESVSREEARRDLGVEGRRVLTYVGALGGWYMTDEMADFLAAAHRQDAQTFSLILTQSPPEMMAERLRARGVAESDFLVRRVSPDEIPRHLKAADVALSFVKPCFSKLASSPTKIAEYLASGLPVVCTAGVGDGDELISTDRVGAVIGEFNTDAYLRALEEVEELRRDASLAERCRASAVKRFDLEGVGGAKYRRLYARLLRVGREAARARGAAGAARLPGGGAA